MNTIQNPSMTENTIEDSDLSRSYAVVRGSMKKKIPPSLIISYATLRVLNPIGQGMLLTRMHAHSVY